MKSFRCKEAAVYQADKLKVDAENGILYAPKILGFDSKNQRTYTKSACQKALALYDGTWVNLNHCHRNTLAPGPRPVEARFGRIRGVELRDDGIYAKEVHFNPKHSFAPTLVWWAEHEPGALGFSHDAILQGPRLEDGRRSVEEISRVFSVDIVADPGSTNGFFEEAMNDDEATPDLGAEPMGFEESAAQLVSAIFADGSLSFDEKKKKILAVLKMCNEEEKSDEKPESKSEEKPKDESTMEQEVKKLRLELDAFRAKEQAEKDRSEKETKAREACKKHGLDTKFISPLFMDDLIEHAVESWDERISERKTLTAGRPKSSAPDTKPSNGKVDEAAVNDFVSRMGA